MDKLFLSLAVIFCWGLWGFFSKLAVVKVGAGMATIWNSIFSVFVILVLLYSKFSFKMDFSGGLLLFLGAASSAVGGILFYRLISAHPASIIISLTSLYPLITIVLSLLFLHEGITLRQALGIVFAMIAVFLLG